LVSSGHTSEFAAHTLTKPRVNIEKLTRFKSFPPGSSVEKGMVGARPSCRALERVFPFFERPIQAVTSDTRTGHGNGIITSTRYVSSIRTYNSEP
jgi:hypothetical protein